MSKKQENAIEHFVNSVTDLPEAINAFIALRIGWDIYEKLDNNSGPVFYKEVEDYLENGGFIVSVEKETNGEAKWAYTDAALYELGRLGFTKETTALDIIFAIRIKSFNYV